MKKRVLPLLLMAVLAFSSVNVAYAADDCNQSVSMFREPDYTDEEDEIVEELQEGMLAREEHIKVYFEADSDSREYSKEYANELADKWDDWLEEALEETDDPHEGDYLRWAYDNVDVKINYSFSPKEREYKFTFCYHFAFYTDYDQEEELQDEIEDVLEDLHIDDLEDDYKKTKAIYDYICQNIYYDYDGLDDDNDVTKYTAYGALVEKSAVCQGYATLFYLMLEEAGIDARVITGTSQGQNHAWNITKLGQKYYLSDATWDAERAHHNVAYEYFLKGTANFPDHETSAEYCSETFLSAYDEAAEDYALEQEPQDPQEPQLKGVVRVFGETRYETSIKTADALKETLGVDKFDTVIIASGTGFADALAGSYLAAVKDAPILMTSGTNIGELKNYIKANMNTDGQIYILGGQVAVPTSVEDAFSEYKNVKRLSGDDRYETNIAILKEAGVDNQDLLVCTGVNFADSLSGSAVGKPMLLVGNSLTPAQKKYLATVSIEDIYVIGGVNAVKETVAAELKTFDQNKRVTRLAGADRFATSALVAEEFFEEPQAAVLAYAMNFPDGLCGGPLAYSLGGPLLLTKTGSEASAAEYAKEAGITSGYVLGGPTLISDKSADMIFGLEEDTSIDKDDTGTVIDGVYSTPTGKRYHYSKNCAGENAIETTLEKAQERGLTGCQKCVY